MFCPFCGVRVMEVTPFCSNCGNSLQSLQDELNMEPKCPKKQQPAKAEAQAGCSSWTGSPKQDKPPTCPTYATFLKYRTSKGQERTDYRGKGKGKGKGDKEPMKDNKRVQINIGLMQRTQGELKAVRGKTLPLAVTRATQGEDLLQQAVAKMTAFNKDLREGPYVLLYPDGSEALCIPGTDRPFTVGLYKDELGKPWGRIILYICTFEDFTDDGGLESEANSDDTEVIVRSRATAEFCSADTVVFDPTTHSTLDSLEDGTEQSSAIPSEQIVISDTECVDAENPTEADAENPTEADGENPTETVKKTPYTIYTELYSTPTTPCVEEQEDLAGAASSPDEQHTEIEDPNITVADIISNLAQVIDHGKVSRFNIWRSDIWDGAVRGFSRSTFAECNDLLVHFSDDSGVLEDGLDAGGPKREFLSLLMKTLKDRPIFDGPDGQKFLVYNAKAVREDQYFLAGKMIAVSVVHGGPGPHFLSENIVNFLAGTTKFQPSVASVTDGEIRKALEEIQNASSLSALRESVMAHTTMFQTAGCLRFPSAVKEKEEMVSDYLRWYIIERNTSVLNRFKEGLSSLGFLNALQQHPTYMTPVLIEKVKKLDALDLERLFKADLSEQGSNRRMAECKNLAFWRDYLLDCEEKKKDRKLSLEDILFFATGLTSLPPSGLDPEAKLLFLEDSRFPKANTCANTLLIPLLGAAEEFMQNMDFGIANSPGFGLH